MNSIENRLSELEKRVTDNEATLRGIELVLDKKSKGFQFSEADDGETMSLIILIEAWLDDISDQMLTPDDICYSKKALSKLNHLLAQCRNKFQFYLESDR